MKFLFSLFKIIFIFILSVTFASVKPSSRLHSIIEHRQLVGFGSLECLLPPDHRPFPLLLAAPVHGVVDDELVTLVAVDAQLLGVHAHRVRFRLLLVLQTVGRHIPAQSLSPSSTSRAETITITIVLDPRLPRVPAAVERAAGDTDPDGGRVFALPTPELGLEVRQDGEARSWPASAHTVQVRALHPDPDQSRV